MVHSGPLYYFRTTKRASNSSTDQSGGKSRSVTATAPNYDSSHAGKGNAHWQSTPDTAARTVRLASDVFVGGVLAGDGRQGSMIPKPGAGTLTQRHGRLIGTEIQGVESETVARLDHNTRVRCFSAIHIRSRPNSRGPNTQVRSHKRAQKLQALHGSARPHRSAIRNGYRTEPGSRSTHCRFSQRPEVRSRNYTHSDADTHWPMRWLLKAPRQLLRERELS
jgi:hypothetical protein